MSSASSPSHEHRASASAAQVLRAGDVDLNVTAHAVSVRGRLVALSLQEFRLLQILLEHADQVMSSRDLLDQVWGQGYLGDPGTLAVHILRLRTKLERRAGADSHIRTVRGLGYVFDTVPLTS